MMKQMTFATSGFERYAKTTAAQRFWRRWTRWFHAARCRLIEPYYPKRETAVRRSGWSACKNADKAPDAGEVAQRCVPLQPALEGREGDRFM